MMKITTLSLSISVFSLLAVLSPAQASEWVMNCTQVSTADGRDTDSQPGNGPNGISQEDDESCIKLLIPFDYGDAPDPTYPTLTSSNGARHQLGSNLFLGQCADTDPGTVAGGILGGMATVDDASKDSPSFGNCTNPDDEDGISVGHLSVGKQKVSVDVVASQACKLNAWIDWEGNGNWTGSVDQVFTNQQLAPGNNTLTFDVPAFAVVGDTYARFRCSTLGGDTFMGEAADGEVEDYKLTIAPSTVVPLSLGDFIWLDSNQDGQQNVGEFGLLDAVVALLNADGTPARDLDGKLLPTQTMTASGAYLFTNLAAGDYMVSVVPPAGYAPTAGGADADQNPSSIDNNCVAGDAGIRTLPVTLAAGTEPDTAADGDNANGNLTVDCGFYKTTAPMHSLGNQMWVDDGAGTAANANNGVFDAGEGAAPNGIQVELRDKSGVAVKQTTTNNGFYLFSGLEAGDYQVCITAGNFGAGSVLAGYTASTGGDESDINLNTDGHDNGSNTLASGLCSGIVTLGNDEPVGETPTATGVAGSDGVGTQDKNSNLTVDFALVPPKTSPKTVTLGDYLWVDTNADGEQGAQEPGLEGATVTLLTASGQVAKDNDGQTVAAQTTGTNGKYQFSNLAAGDYVVKVQQPTGYYLTQGGADVDTDPSNTDSNCVVSGGVVKTSTITLLGGSEPDASVDGEGVDGNMTADCGFYRAMSVGDVIWEDLNANGQKDNSEPGITGMVVHITAADAVTPVTDVAGKPVTSVTTDASGYYHFNNLKPGNYVVTVTPPVKGYHLSPGGADPDANPSETDSNCVSIEGGYQTPAFGLFDALNKGILSNKTIDCGFYRPVAVGSRIWIDKNSDGKQSAGEPGVPGAIVSLLTADGKPATNIHGQVVPSVQTGSNGEYFFGNLAEGDYVISVTPPSGYLPTVATRDPDNNDGTDSNGVVITGGKVSSQPITLSWGDEPATDGDNDASTNLTVGFGFLAEEGSLQIPTVSQWGLGFMSMLLSGMAFWRRRKDRHL